jgi:hypothetical protein
MKKNTIAYLIMGLYVVLLIVGVIFENLTLTSIATAIAILSFLWIQQGEKNKSPDEREHFIVHRSSSTSFMVLVTLLVLGSVFNDFLDLLTLISFEQLLQVVVGIGYMTFVSMYVYYSEKY